MSVGQVFMTAGPNCPSNTLPANGQSLLAIQYGFLYNLIGFTYGGELVGQPTSYEFLGHNPTSTNLQATVLEETWPS